MSHSDLIDAHLDGSATPSDIDQLEAAIATDPTVAHELARSASVEAALAAHFAVNRSTSALITQLKGQARSSPAPSAPPPRAKDAARLDAPSRSPQCRVAFQATSQGPLHTPCAPSVDMPWHSRTSADRWRFGAAAAVVLALGIAGAAIAGCTAASHFPRTTRQPLPSQKTEAPAGAVSSLPPRPPSFAKLGENARDERPAPPSRRILPYHPRARKGGAAGTKPSTASSPAPANSTTCASPPSMRSPSRPPRPQHHCRRPNRWFDSQRTTSA